MGSLSSLSLLSGISSKVPPFESWESLTSQVSGAFWGIPPTSYFLRLPVYILSAGPQGFSPFPYSAIKNEDILSFAGKWMELENIILCEVTQTQKDMHGMVSLISGY